MRPYEIPQEPSCDEWKEHELPKRCVEMIDDVCADIMRKGEKTKYQAIYNAIYEIVEAEIEYEYAKSSEEE